MSILLELEESSEEVVAGIPKFVTISSSEPSIIYYTLDGTDPDDSSLIYVDKIYIPTNNAAVTLKYVAFYSNTFSSIFEENYQSYFEKTLTSRKGGEDGIDIFSGESEILYYYDSEGEQIQASTIPFEDLDITTSRTDNLGNPVGSTKSFINFVDRQLGRRYSRRSSTGSSDFDRHADVIHIDGSTQAAMDAQVVSVVNRPYDNMSPRSSFYIESFDRESNYLNGNLVNYVYNSVTGEIVFNYFDSRENRWIKSKQKTTPKQFDLSKTYSSGNNKVFVWIKDPVMSKMR